MITSETSNDYLAISSILKDAFAPSESEAKLVEALRYTSNYNPELSLLALDGDEAVGYILFYPLNITYGTNTIPTLGLVPLGVKRTHQNKGYGASLVREGLKRAEQLGYQSVFVVGNPEYYGRFGFRRANQFSSNLAIPEEVFLFLELKKGALKETSGIVIYPPEFTMLD